MILLQNKQLLLISSTEVLFVDPFRKKNNSHIQRIRIVEKNQNFHIPKC